MKLWQWTTLLWFKLGSPAHFVRFASKVHIPLWIVAWTLWVIGLGWGLIFAPADYQQGEAFRIIYWHVPMAALALNIYVGLGICALVYFIWRIQLAFLFSYALAVIGTVYTAIALVSGSLWGKPMWGTYWTWDARLTSTFVLFFLYLGFFLLFTSFSSPKQGRLAASLLAIVGVINVPIIRYSVYWWNSLHQGTTVLNFATPTIAPAMKWPLYVCLFAAFVFTLAFVFTFVLRQLQTPRQ